MITKNNILELIKEQKKFENKFRNLNSRNFNLLSNSEKRYISFYYINEINKLNDIALLNEFINTSAISNIANAGSIANFLGSSSLGSGVGQTILEGLLKTLLEKYLGIKDNFLISLVINYLLDDPATLMKSFTNCNVFTEKLVDAFVETMVQKKLQPKIFKDGFLTGVIGDTLRNTLMELLQNNEMKKKLMQTLTPIVCKFISTGFAQLKNKFFG
jgi:hypothetical protein